MLAQYNAVDGERADKVYKDPQNKPRYLEPQMYLKELIVCKKSVSHVV